MLLHHRILGEGKPLILLHGLFGMSDNLQGFAKMLAENGFRVILPDLRNHGHAFHADEHTYQAMADDIRQLVTALKIDKPVIIGHSMGGKVAMKYLNNYQDEVSDLVVIDIAPYYYPVHHTEILDALNSIDINAINSRSEAEKILMDQLGDNSTIQFLMKNMYRKDEGYKWRFNLPVLTRDIENVGEDTIPAPPVYKEVLFIKGSKSGYIRDHRIQEIKNAYPNYKLVSINDSGHWVHAEKPKELLEAILEFIKRERSV